MYQTLSAIDSADPKVARALSLMDENGRSAGTYYPDHYSTAIFDGQLYDYFGRPIPVSKNIKRVLRPFGQEGGRGETIGKFDRFLVELISGRHAILTLQRTDKQSIFGTQHSLREILDYAREMSFSLIYDREADYSYKSVSKDALQSTCFDALPRDETFPGLYLATEPRLYNKIYHNAFCFIAEGEADFTHHGPWLPNVIASSRETILSAPTYFRAHTSSSHLYGEAPVFSYDGQKVSAFIRDNGGYTRVSTDAKVLAASHYAGYPCLFWYLDPLDP
ncbi:hypothetical protein IJ095_02160 [Candidatus Saccharibacteria bacterium]|nr:hypothetical protein [Candidatus Saccharibacteria bacterium]